MLEQSRGIRVDRRIIVRLHKGGEDADVVEALELEDEARDLLGVVGATLK